jgi:dolichyl-phosphate beta-glucosyltransferase
MTKPASAEPRRCRLGLVVPVYNEAGRFDRCAAELVEFASSEGGGVEVLFVDDGSTDDTAFLAERLIAAHSDLPVRLLRRPHAGKGAAVAAGLRTLATDIGAFCDLDLATPLADLRRIVDVASSAPVLAIGSRDLDASVLERPEHPVREFLGRAFNRYLQLTITPGILDTQCGAKAARREVWAEVLELCEEPGFAWDAELVAVCLRRGIPVRELPVQWRHDPESKVRVARDGSSMVRAVHRIRRRVRRIEVPPSRSRRPTEVFDDARAAELLDAGRDHWWFRSKAAFVSTALRRTGRVRSGPLGRLVDLGAGPGAVTAMLGVDPDATIVVDGNPALVRCARDDYGLTVAAGSVDSVPFAPRSMAVVCLLDVIEHLDEPTAALGEARRLLRPGGRLLVNVPAHRWLWSSADEHLGHRRRYNRRMLRDELDRSGFEVMLITHVFSWLVPAVWLRRRLAREGEPQLGLDARSGAIDTTATVLTFGERQLVGRISLPIGTSVLAVATPR